MSVHHLRITIQPLEAIVFGDQAGSALRGGLYKALSDNFCSEPQGWLTPNHVDRCPVCWLLAAENQRDRRGQDIPRPLTVEPPVGSTRVFSPKEPFSFGFSLIGQAQALLPFMLRAVQKMGASGVGRGRGRFKIVDIREYSPLWDTERALLDKHVIRSATLHINAERVMEAAQHLPTQAVTVDFLTPMRLIASKGLVKTPDFCIFIQRLLERCQRLSLYYRTPSFPFEAEAWQVVYQSLRQAAQAIKPAYQDIVWEEAYSGSRRLGRSTPIGGLLGRVRWEGDLTPFLPWLLWGQSLHVGKDAVKGNGWYRLIG